MRKVRKGRRYVTRRQAESILGSVRPERIIGKWYRDDEVYCSSNCRGQRAQFINVKNFGGGRKFCLRCRCGGVFLGWFVHSSFFVAGWFSPMYLQTLHTLATRPQAKKTVQKLYALMGLNGRS